MVANLLFRRMGGVWVPGTRDSERMADSLSTSSATKGDTERHVTKANKWCAMDKCINCYGFMTDHEGPLDGE